MTSEPTASSVANEAALGSVTVEAVSWVTRFTGGDGTGRLLFPEPLRPGDTPLTVLRRVGDRLPELAAVLWGEGGALTEHVQLMLNDALIGPDEAAATVLEPGDVVSLLGQYMGG